MDSVAAELNARMVEHLTMHLRGLPDDLSAAIRAVPRHFFVRRGYFEPVPGSSPTAYRAVQAGSGSAWLETIYSDQPLVTQVAGTLFADQMRGEVLRAPSSSSSEPGLVAFVLKAAALKPGMRVFEAGTGTGWNAGILCALVGEDNVVTMEADPTIAEDARINLAMNGRHPEVVVGDGRAGYAEEAPYDALIATFGVSRISPEWLEQVRPGGVIIAGIRGRLEAHGLARLVVGDDGTAEGAFLSTGNYMQARQELAPEMVRLPDPVTGKRRTTRVPADLLNDPAARLIADNAIPTFQQFPGMQLDASQPPADWFVDADTGSFAIVETKDGRTTVNQGGPDSDAWARVESGLLAWQAAGSPPVEQLRIVATGEGQSIGAPSA
ncbi:protein-L-isoaspartate(D-aspartate) O-methyltransferase [Embleya sp. NBC_00896]|uniref:protein-L-isoaspartate(D-aspartate) O-methyltransferase n=1 Tax=Embleya sp. NBC_00896 TaxID=2975961 RepID=UPI00386C8D50|nr:protein-L-isoaspartate(D-aspartate) O-methyltransferase [Embleya sp. NBC_00896]